MERNGLTNSEKMRFFWSFFVATITNFLGLFLCPKLSKKNPPFFWSISEAVKRVVILSRSVHTERFSFGCFSSIFTLFTLRYAYMYKLFNVYTGKWR